MSNTIDPALIVDTLAVQSQTVLANRLAALRLFSTDFSSDVKKPKDTVQVAIATATAATQTNPTTFNSIGGTTLGKATVELNHLYQPFGLEYSDLQVAQRLERLVKINLDALADKIWAVATAPITVANFGAATVTAANSAITPTSGDLPKLWAGISKAGRKGLIVNPSIYANLIPTSTTSLPLSEGAYGFDNGVFYASQFPSEAKLAGFACAPEALAMAAAAPSLDHVRNSMIVSETVTLEGLGMSIYYNVWADESTRALVASAELMFGSAKGVTSGTIASIYNP